MKEILNHFKTQIGKSKILSELELNKGKYILASIHRSKS